jgi:cell division protein FtsI (penicillin-binding protein 3)
MLVMSFLFGLFSLLLMTFFQIQIVDGKKWALLGKRQHFFEVREAPLRGVFFANAASQKVPLVFDLEIWHLFVDPEAIPEEKKGALQELLAGVLGLSSQESEGLYVKSRSRRLKSGLSRHEKDSLFALWTPFAKKNRLPKNALYAVRDYQRSYPFGSLLGQVLHTIQGVKEEGTQLAIPTGGLELSLNEWLKGKGGKRLLMRSPRNAFETGEVIETPVAGADVELTVNILLQAICEEELKKGVLSTGSKGGVALMMDPRSGEILALAEYPFFDPGRYQEYFNTPEKIEHTKVRAITDANELGSVMKPLTAALALKASSDLKGQGKGPLFDPEEKIKTHNQVFPGRKKPIKDTKLHYYLNMDMAIQKSSNIYAALLVDRMIKELGASWYRTELVNTFGFGQKTGIELPGESSGVVPKPSQHSKGWSVATPYSMAFGHNLQTTSVQLVRAIAVLVNGGYLVQPHIVRQIYQGETILVDKSDSTRLKVLDEEICKRVVRAMKFVTKPGGSSPKGDVFGYTEGGKSGTANKVVNGAYSETKYVSSFIGFTPAENPAFVLLVTLDEPEYGFVPGIGKIHHAGVATGPIFSEISRRSLDVLGVPPDDPYGYAVNDPRYNREKADLRKDVLVLQEMYEKWNKFDKDETKKIN